MLNWARRGGCFVGVTRLANRWRACRLCGWPATQGRVRPPL